MAHDAPLDAQANSGHRARRHIPEAPRPRADVWRELRNEGIQWEGQILLVGTGADLPALLILTDERAAIVSDGDIILEAPRQWLTPEPRLLADNAVRLSITPVGATAGRDATTQLRLRVRGGRGTAAKLVGAISGRLVSARASSPPHPAKGEPQFAGRASAAPSVALPPLVETPVDAPPTSRGTWPPIEHHAIAAADRRPAPARRHDREGAASGTSISSWTAANLDTWPEPRQGASPSETGYQGLPPADEKPRRRKALAWAFRALILALLLGTGVIYGREYLPKDLNIPLPARLEQRLGLADEEDPADVAQAPVDDTTETPEATTSDSDGTSGPNNSDLVGTRDDGDEDGVGGANGEITPADIGNGMLDNPPPTDVPSPTPEPTDEPVVDVATDPPTQEPATTEPTPQPTAVPTDEPVVEPTDVPATEEPTPVPTEVPATEEPSPAPTDVPATEQPTSEPPTEEPTEVPVTEEPTEEPTEVPATEEPTGVPATATPTESAVTEEPTQTPTESPATEEPTEEPVATLESQEPSVDPNTAPAQSVASGSFRYDLTGISRGETIAELPDLQPVGGYGEWVVITVSGQNTSDTEQVFDMSQFRVIADGREFLLDVGNGWVGSLLGFTPAYGNTDAILWASGEGHEFALTFLVPPGTQSLQLVAGDQVIDLSSTIESGTPVGTEPTGTPGVETIDATVVEVIDAETIVIEKDGITQTVRYLGIDVPTGDDCLAGEATAANAALVEGQTVRLERQATDLDARGNWVRDVWVPASDGGYTLVSQALVAAGMAEAAPSEPNTRFAGWLQGAQATAEAQGAGIWGACTGEESTGTAEVAVIPTRQTVSAWRTRRRIG